MDVNNGGLLVAHVAENERLQLPIGVNFPPIQEHEVFTQIFEKNFMEIEGKGLKRDCSVHVTHFHDWEVEVLTGVIISVRFIPEVLRLPINDYDGEDFGYSRVNFFSLVLLQAYFQFELFKNIWLIVLPKTIRPSPEPPPLNRSLGIEGHCESILIDINTLDGFPTDRNYNFLINGTIWRITSKTDVRIEPENLISATYLHLIQVSRGTKKTTTTRIFEIEMMYEEVNDFELVEVVVVVSIGNDYDIANVLSCALRQVGKQCVGTIDNWNDAKNKVYMGKREYFGGGLLSIYFFGGRHKKDGSIIKANFERKVQWVNLSATWDDYYDWWNRIPDFYPWNQINYGIKIHDEEITLLVIRSIPWEALTKENISNFVIVACTIIATEPLDTASSRMQSSVLGKSQGLLVFLLEGSWADAFDCLGIPLLLTTNPSIKYTVCDQLNSRMLKGNIRNQRNDASSRKDLSAFSTIGFFRYILLDKSAMDDKFMSFDTSISAGDSVIGLLLYDAIRLSYMPYLRLDICEGYSDPWGQGSCSAGGNVMTRDDSSGGYGGYNGEIDWTSGYLEVMAASIVEIAPWRKKKWTTPFYAIQLDYYLSWAKLEVSLEFKMELKAHKHELVIQLIVLGY